MQRDLKSFAGKKTIIKYNQYRMQNQSEILTKEQIKDLGQTYRPDSQMSEIAVKRFLKNEQVKEYADVQLSKILTDNGVTIDFIVKEQKELLELSKKEKQLGVTHKVIESLKTDLGMNNKVKISETRTIKQSNLAENYEKAVEERKNIEVTSSPDEPESAENEE